MVLQFMQKKDFYRNFTDPGKKFVLSLHYNDNNSYLFDNGRQELKFKVKKCSNNRREFMFRKFK